MKQNKNDQFISNAHLPGVVFSPQMNIIIWKHIGMCMNMLGTVKSHLSPSFFTIFII